jgi:hypothetical protein
VIGYEMPRVQMPYLFVVKAVTSLNATDTPSGGLATLLQRSRKETL